MEQKQFLRYWERYGAGIPHRSVELVLENGELKVYEKDVFSSKWYEGPFDFDREHIREFKSLGASKELTVKCDGKTLTRSNNWDHYPSGPMLTFPPYFVQMFEERMTSTSQTRKVDYFEKAYLPKREGINDIKERWDRVIRIEQSPCDDETRDLYIRSSEAISDLIKIAEICAGMGYYDLAYEALGEAERDARMDNKELQQMLNKPIIEERKRLGLEEKVFFVVDFDHTIAQTNIAHENLRRAMYASLPEATKESLGYETFCEIFSRAYKDHQKEAGMHKPEIMVRYLTKYLGLSEASSEMSQAYAAYCNSFQGNLFEGAVNVLDRWNRIGSTTILTFGDDLLQKISVRQSGIEGFVGDVEVTEQKSPNNIFVSLLKAGYNGSGYIVGVGDKPSDTEAIKEFGRWFGTEVTSIRLRHQGGKYSNLESKSLLERADFEFPSFYEIDNNFHIVFKAILKI